jgi:quinol---cytochrome c reductase iron-sulfur subunit, bacillus type
MSLPDPYQEPTPTPPERRVVLRWLALATGALASLVLGIPLLGYLFGTLIKRQPDDWVDLGPVNSFPQKQTMLVNFDLPVAQRWDGEARKASAYVRHQDDGSFVVFAVNCAHLGCPVSWFPASGLFLCPCHGGVYYEDGARASGPPPRGLYPYEIQFVREGKQRQVVSAKEYERLDTDQRGPLILQIKAGHVPTLHDPLRKPDKGTKA